MSRPSTHAQAPSRKPILEAESAEALEGLLQGHPHRTMGGTIETLEFLTMPGM